MKCLKTLVTGKAKAAIEVDYKWTMYRVAWQTLARNFGRRELVVNAQLKKINSDPFIQPHDPSAVIKFSQNVSGCVNVLTQFGYENDLTSKSVLKGAVRKLLNGNQATRLLTYLQRHDSSFKTVLSAWMKSIAEIQENLKMQLGTARKRAVLAVTSRKQLLPHPMLKRRKMCPAPNVLWRR